jgi:hypothetical protein
LEFDLSNLAAGFVFGVFGISIFRTGKKNGDFAQVFIGITLMLYPYFVSNAWLTWIIGIVLCVFAYKGLR